MCWYITCRHIALKSIKLNSIYKHIYTHLMTYKMNGNSSQRVSKSIRIIIELLNT